MASQLEVTIFDGVGGLPHFDPGVADVPAQVAAFLDLLGAADGVIICTPEYAHGVPGSLKNALDWTVTCQGNVGGGSSVHCLMNLTRSRMNLGVRKVLEKSSKLSS